MDFCDVSRLEGFGDLGRQRGSIWRFLVMDDPTVRRYLVRDLDSLLTKVRLRIALPLALTLALLLALPLAQAQDSSALSSALS